ncbi:MAG: nitronate monooxygenase [Alphaproteobacteria bacterium]|jgi:NAD(P)H-dependent flavin oxidoreductase YrpB (nitropropane dioxygenase family)|nr:nitronate monooxygenase [Alphaproteobacteria bacterium]
MNLVKALRISGADVLPLFEGGKGVAVTNGVSAGAWAATGGVGTFSGVNADFIDELGRHVPLIYRGRTRKDRHDELMEHSIQGGVSQAKIAHDMSGGAGRIHMNVLWEMAGCERVLHGVLEQAKGLIHGITCGAGMPYRLSEIAAQYGVHYHPIVSSGRAFRALWKRAYHRFSDWLGSVVYEDPWLAGGHNGLSNNEDPTTAQDPYPRVAELRRTMRKVGLDDTPIVMAGGVWWLRDWSDWIDNPELGPIAFQFGTRPLLTQESPIPEVWKQRLLELEPGDVLLQRFSPTGFYSSAVNNAFMQELIGRSERQAPYREAAEGEFTSALTLNARGKQVYLTAEDAVRVEDWREQGFTTAMRTPDETLVFVTPDAARQIKRDQADCMGCLSQCRFSNWATNETNTTGHLPDPRSFCIQKTLQDISHGGDIEHNLMFAGHNVFKFRQDPFYANGFVPTVRQLVQRIRAGD